MSNSIKLITKGRYLKLKSFTIWILLFALFIWSLRRIVFESFVYAIPRNFRGDFYTAMYEFIDTPGVSMLFGPVFLIEQHFAINSPPYFSINFFAFLNAALMIFALGVSLLACRINLVASATTVVLWCMFNPLFYSLSVAANPEIVELALLSGAWFFLKKGHSVIPWILIPLAILMKLIPVIFLPLLFLHFKRKGLSFLLLTCTFVISIASLLSGKNPFSIVIALVFPQIPLGYTSSTSGISLVMNPPTTMQFSGLNSSVWRLLKLESKSETTQLIVSSLSILFTLTLYLWILVVVYRLIQRSPHLPKNLKYSLIFGLLFAFMPLATMQAHPHTFLFLLPCITATLSIIAHENNKRNRLLMGAFSLVVYIILGGSYVLIPLDWLLGSNISDSTIFQEPIWATVLFVISLAMWSERVRKTHDISLRIETKTR
jgi:hypothetical protein